MPLYEFACLAHGKFEKILTVNAGIPPCPHGCGNRMVQKMLSAPNFISGRTKGIDSTLATLAKDHGLSDMNNHNGTTGAFQPDASFTKAQQQMQADMMRGQTYSAPMDGGSNAIQNTMQTGGFKPDNA